MDLQLSTRRIGGSLVVALGGIADLSTAPRLSDGLARITADDPGESIVVDLDGLVILDDVALGLLLGMAARCRASGGKLAVVCTDPRIRARLAETRVDQIVPIRASVA